MTEETRPKTGRYLYAIVAGTADRADGPIGIEGGSVYTISAGRVSAVVSDVPDQKVRPERRHLAAHQEVLKRLLGETTPLPMAFGIIADGPHAIQKILSRNEKTFLGQLQRVTGKVEMGVRVTWDVPNIFEYFVQTHPDLRVARDQFLGTHREPTQEEKIEVGRMFDRLLNEDREAHAQKVEEVLAPLCSEIKHNPSRNEREVMNLACLIERDAQKRFEEGIFEAAKGFDDSFALDFNGPWAPHNFVEIELER
jgi:hypothetical protein